MKDNHFASKKLRSSLSGIAKQLKETQSVEGKWVRKERVDGYDLEWAPNPPNEMGLNKVTFINIEVDLWRELGSILERVADGGNARRLFGQHLRTNPSKDGEHRLRALAYWSVRTRDPEADDAEALELARRIVAIPRNLKPGTLRKYAQRHRARCLCLLSLHSNWTLRFESSGIEIRALGPGIVPLVSYLRRKEDRERWLKPPPFQSITDVLFITPRGQQERQPAFPGMSLHAEELPPGASLHLEKRDALMEQIRVTYPTSKHQE